MRLCIIPKTIRPYFHPFRRGYEHVVCDALTAGACPFVLGSLCTAFCLLLCHRESKTKLVQITSQTGGKLVW